MIKSISKNKIPRQYAYVLKTGQLERLLDENGLDIHVDLNYCLTNNSFWAHFYLPNDRVPYDRLYIVVGVLRKEDAFFAREKMESVALPEFVLWLKSILALPDDSPRLKHGMSFRADYQDNEVVIKMYL